MTTAEILERELPLLALRYGEDAAQDAAVGLLEAADSLDPARCHVRVWLRRRMVDQHRQRCGRHGHKSQATVALPRSAACPGPDPAREAIARLEVQELLRGLDRTERLAVQLYYLADLTNREIGQVIGVCESRVSMLLTRVRGELRAMRRAAG